MEPSKREVVYRSFDEIFSDIDRLHSQGYKKLRNWDLGQTLFHLTEWVRYPMDGFPRLPLPLKPIFWFVRTFFAKKLLAKVFRDGGFKEGSATAPVSVATGPVDETEAIARYKETVARWKSWTKEPLPSPLFGRFKRDDLDRLHLIHTAHHLSFLIPKS
jgi:hypothetical protein